jgi:hypothetical protein
MDYFHQLVQVGFVLMELDLLGVHVLDEFLLVSFQ